MIKYTITAIALKGFSINTMTRRLYRFLGNTYGMRKRLRNNIPAYYVERIKRMLRLCRDYHIVKDGDRILEVGTGWLHWEAMTVKLFYDVQAILFDVWDNRQFDALKHYFTLLNQLLLDNTFDLDKRQRVRAREIITRILSANSIDALYQELDFQYVIDSNGALERLKDQSFDIIVSAGVLEHVHKGKAGVLVEEFHRLLKPGGFVINLINIGDHLYAYDASASQKEYLRFSDSVWGMFFQNDVQYFNRIQRSEWMSLFNNAGLKLIKEESEFVNMDALKVHGQFKYLTKSDIECISLKIVHQRPVDLLQ